MILAELLGEALDKAVEFEVVEETKTYFKAEFESNGRTIVFDAERAFNDDGDDLDDWAIAFVQRVPDGFTRWDVTKGGKEFEVFATIKKIIAYFFKRYDPQHVRFTSDKSEANRSDLYVKLFKKFLPAGYALERDDESSNRLTSFVITKL